MTFPWGIFDFVTGDREVRSLGLDVGGRRTGVAISDPQGILATPLTVLVSKDENTLIREILTLVEQHKVQCVVIGLPRQLSGELGKQANKVTAFADKLSAQAKQSSLSYIDMQLWDERLSTKAAERLKAGAGRRKGNPRVKSNRGGRSDRLAIKAEVDAVAAALILQSFLDSQRLHNSDES